MSDYLLNAFATLLVTIDPIGLAPLFLAVTRGASAEMRSAIAVRASVIATIILVAFALTGTMVLTFLGISLPAFRIAGGLLLFWIAFEMVFERRGERKKQTAAAAVTLDHIRNVAAFPLAIPLMAGPGVLTAMILLASRAERDPLLLAALAVIAALVILCCLVVFLLATPLARLLGVTGNVVLTRLLGVILAALAVQFVIDGVKAAFRMA